MPTSRLTLLLDVIARNICVLYPILGTRPLSQDFFGVKRIALCTIPVWENRSLDQDGWWAHTKRTYIVAFRKEPRWFLYLSFWKLEQYVTKCAKKTWGLGEDAQALVNKFWPGIHLPWSTLGLNRERVERYPRPVSVFLFTILLQDDIG